MKKTKNQIKKIITEKITKIDIYNIRRFVEKYNAEYKREYQKFINNSDNYVPIFTALKKINIPELNELFLSSYEKFYYFNIDIEQIDKKVYLVLVYALLLTIYQLGETSAEGEFSFSEKNNKPFFNYTEKELEINEFKSLANKKTGYYRGHSDCSWRLIPSIVRSLNQDVIMNSDYICNKLYKENKLVRKYLKYINKNKRLNIYEMYAFIQHSIAYSTLLDLTTNPIVATSFSLCNPSKKNEFSIDSSVLKIEMTNKLLIENNVINDVRKAEQILQDNGYCLLNKKCFSFCHDEIVHEYRKGKTKDVNITFNSFQEIVQHLIPNCFIINCPVNDRMRYQDGSFIYFCGDNFVIFKDDFLYEFTYGLKVTKYIIKKKNKDDYLNDIYCNHRDYDIDHLMDPYKIFTE